MSTIQTVAGYTLLPHQANWNNPPTRQRVWRATVTAALSGTEDRTNVRNTPWVQMDFEVMPVDHIERSKFQARYEAGLKLGKLAVPFWGRSVELTMDAIAGATTLNVDRVDAGMVAGKFVFLQSFRPAEYETFEVCQLGTPGTTTLPITQPLANSYLEGNRVWQILFGKPIPQEATISNNTRTTYKVSLLYDARQINAFAADNFLEYPLGQVVDNLSGGSGWNGPWYFGSMAA